MILDSQLSFVPVGAPLSLVGAAGASIPSTNVIDLLGQGVGTAPANIIGNAALFGTDVGVGGRVRPELNVVIGTAAVTANSATLDLALQAAPDTGAAGGYLPGTWQTLEESGPLTAAQLTAGQVIMRLPFPPAFPSSFFGGLRPRFLRLLAQVPSGTNFTAGTIASATVTMVRDDQTNKIATKNFIVA